MHQLLRYAIVGLCANLAGYLAYLLLTSLGLPPIAAMTILYCVCTALGFIGNRKLTFEYKGATLGSAVRYLAAQAFGYLINLSMLMIFVDKLGYAHQLVQGAAVFLVAAYMFTASKYWVFRDFRNPEIKKKP